MADKHMVIVGPKGLMRFPDADVVRIAVGEVLVELPTSPDLLRERFIGGSLRPATPAEQQEATDADAARANSHAAAQLDDARVVKAAVLTALRGRLGRNPTPAEIAAERAVFIQFYKLLAVP